MMSLNYKELENEDEAKDLDEKYSRLKACGKKLCKGVFYKEALQKFREAYEIHQDEALKERIEKIEEFLKDDEEENGASQSTTSSVTEGFRLNENLYAKLYPYQREALKWLWGLHRAGKGGILADDMGLGKTVQIISFLTGLMDAGEIKTALIVTPVSLIQNWEAETDAWSPGLRRRRYHGLSATVKERNLNSIQKKGGILFTSYNMIVHSGRVLARRVDSDAKFNWDYLILDEGHKIKNPTKTTKEIHEFSAGHRLVLTGTPVQNNLKELWALYDFCHQGSLLGTLTTFKARYETPINRSREKDASVGVKELGARMAENLRKLIAPYFLRRTKADAITVGQNCASLPAKNDLIIWVQLSRQQVEIYQKFLDSDLIKDILTKNRSNPLVYLVAMKKICDHPRLFSVRARTQLRHEIDLDDSDDEVEVEAPNDAVADVVSLNVDPFLLLKESGKMEVLIKLLDNLKAEGHRTLVFSLSSKILDIIQKILLTGNWKVLRLDGKIRSLDERQRRIQLFQTDHQYSVFLLTTQVGGVGLNLTGADRVVIYDPSWNPATDAQAVDRAYRIGQSKDVLVYRLITCGAIEEKIYRRQIFKDSITRQATCRGDDNDKDPHRYFTKSELRELFVLDDPMSSATQIHLSKLHENLKETSPALDRHISQLERLEGVFGVSHHDLMFHSHLRDDSHDAAAAAAIPDDEKIIRETYIQHQVEDAERRIHLESAKNERRAREAGSYKTTYFEEAPEEVFFALPGHEDEFYDNALGGLTLDTALFDQDEEDAFIEDTEIPEIISNLANLPEDVQEGGVVGDASLRFNLPPPAPRATPEVTVDGTLDVTAAASCISLDDDGHFLGHSSGDSSPRSLVSPRSNKVNVEEPPSNARVSLKNETFRFGLPKKYAQKRNLSGHPGRSKKSLSAPSRGANKLVISPRRAPPPPPPSRMAVRLVTHHPSFAPGSDENGSAPAPAASKIQSPSRNRSAASETTPSSSTRPSLTLVVPEMTISLPPIVIGAPMEETDVRELKLKLKRSRKKNREKDRLIEDLKKSGRHLKARLKATQYKLERVSAQLETPLRVRKEASSTSIGSTTEVFASLDGGAQSPIAIARLAATHESCLVDDVALTRRPKVEIDLDRELALLRDSLNSALEDKAATADDDDVKDEPMDAEAEIEPIILTEKLSFDLDSDDDLPDIIMETRSSAASTDKVKREAMSPTSNRHGSWRHRVHRVTPLQHSKDDDGSIFNVASKERRRAEKRPKNIGQAEYFGHSSTPKAPKTPSVPQMSAALDAVSKSRTRPMVIKLGKAPPERADAVNTNFFSASVSESNLEEEERLSLPPKTDLFDANAKSHPEEVDPESRFDSLGGRSDAKLEREMSDSSSAESFRPNRVKMETETLFERLIRGETEADDVAREAQVVTSSDEDSVGEAPSVFQTLKDKYKDLFTFSS